jgi:hypothetical protein
MVRQAVDDLNGMSLSRTASERMGFAQVGDAPFARGAPFNASGKCEFYSERLKDLDPLPTYIPREKIAIETHTRKAFSAGVDFPARASLPPIPRL